MERPETEHFKQIFKQYEELLDRTEKAYSPVLLAEVEREAMLHNHELQICAARLWDEYIKIARKRRTEIATGQVTPPQEQQPTVYCEMPATRKKKTTKKGKK